MDEKDKKIRQQKELIDRLAEDRKRLKRENEQLKGVIVKLGDQR